MTEDIKLEDFQKLFQPGPDGVPPIIKKAKGSAREGLQDDLYKKIKAAYKRAWPDILKEAKGIAEGAPDKYKEMAQRWAEGFELDIKADRIDIGHKDPALFLLFEEGWRGLPPVRFIDYMFRPDGPLVRELKRISKDNHDIR